MVEFFTFPDAWTGGFYELAVEIDPSSNSRLSDAMCVLWRHPDLDGCFLDRNCEPSDQIRVSPSLDSTHLFGLASLPNGPTFVCGTCFVREMNGSDWLNFYVPLGSVSQHYQVGGYPFETDDARHRTWQKPLDEWLRDLGLYLYSTVKFRLALIGFEASGEYTWEQIGRHGIPARREYGFLWPKGDQIKWFPPSD